MKVVNFVIINKKAADARIINIHSCIRGKINLDEMKDAANPTLPP